MRSAGTWFVQVFCPYDMERDCQGDVYEYWVEADSGQAAIDQVKFGVRTRVKAWLNVAPPEI